ncbi:DUF2946 family protein [uncultured Shimia sp.]|uniref:DUF2946 family protein n=1 Tax=uncultured Shimia sp. TaxID=573152 RepID=UPI002611EF4D|nr:DUF2946 family protein [uncultured Shimia sp.]
MPVHWTSLFQSKWNAPLRKPLLRRFAGILAVLSLMFQMLAPSLASASQGDWIEICSEYGTVLKQIDLSNGERPPASEHIDCEDCTFCAFAAPMSPPIGPEFDLPDASLGMAVRWAELMSDGVERYKWPESRGPPAAPQDHNAMRECRASTALTNFQGGAL